MKFNEISDYIRPYQAHNILKAYSNKLIRQSGKSANQQIYIPAEGRRQAIIEKVTDNIINKITRVGFLNKRFYNMTEQRLYEPQNSAESKETQFIYHKIDKNNKKIQCKFSIKDSHYLIRNIRELQLFPSLLRKQ